MKNLSQWASRHVYPAILLIILGEVFNDFNGVLLGANLLGKVPTAYLYGGMLILTGVSFFALLTAKKNHLTSDYWTDRRWLFTAFLGNFMLFTLLGGVWNQRVEKPHASVSVLGSRRVEIVGDTLSPVSSVRSANQSAARHNTPSSDQPSDPRGLYVLLGVLGIAVGLFVTGLACNIACAGYGFLAAVTFILGLGGLAGSAYFFGRAAQKPPKRRRDMTPDERKRDNRRFWLAWLLTIGVVGVLFLLSAAFSK